MQEKLGFSIEEATVYTGIGRTSLYTYMTSGELPRRYAGRRVILLRDDLDKLITNLPDKAEVLA